MSISFLSRGLGSVLIVLSLAACGSKVNLDNYNRLKSGQGYDEVKTILGEPTTCDEVLGVRSCTWGEKDKGISVNFLAGQVVLFAAHNLK